MTATTTNPSIGKLEGITKIRNWTEFSCAWLDEIYNIQVFYTFICIFS